MPRLYAQGADLEREHCHQAISNGALVAMRGAGSKCYSRDCKYKVDTIIIYQDKIVVTQHKKRGNIDKRDLVNLMELQRLIPSIEVCVGTTSELKKVSELVSEIFK